MKQKTGQLIDKAERAIKAAERVLDDDAPDFAAGRANCHPSEQENL